MKVALTGASGLVGRKVCDVLTAGGHQVVRLVRGAEAGRGTASWDPSSGIVAGDEFAGVEAVIHLAGENIASGRWTQEKKEKIERSRVESTGLLCHRLAALDCRPRVLVCASAIGFYGDTGSTLVDEAAPAGSGFLASLCRRWEDACAPAREQGIRVVNLRIGVVLAKEGGALAKMLPPFQMGLGGVIGDGNQYMSWISLDDVAGITEHALADSTLSGPVNVVAPAAVTNAEFTRILAKVLSRPAVFPVPAFAARMLFGEMADELLLSSVRVRPGKLEAGLYKFRYPDLEGALRHALGKQ